MVAKGIDEHFECSPGSNAPGVTTAHLGRASVEEEEPQTVQCRNEAVTHHWSWFWITEGVKVTALRWFAEERKVLLSEGSTVLYIWRGTTKKGAVAKIDILKRGFANAAVAKIYHT